MKIGKLVAAFSAIASSALVSHADVVKCSTTHKGEPSSLVVYIERANESRDPKGDNIVLAKTATAQSEASIIAHFRGDKKETGYDADNGIQLKVVEKNALQREEQDGASASRLVMGKPFEDLNDLHILWWQNSMANMETSTQFISQIREDMTAGLKTAEPVTGTLFCQIIAAPGVKSGDRESLHSFVESDLGVKP